MAGERLTARAERLLRQSIPQRLAELYACILIIDGWRQDKPETGTINLGTVALECSPAKHFILHPYLDAAIITCRNLLKLFGIGLAGDGTDLPGYDEPQEGTDAWIEDFRLRPLSVGDACKGHDGLTEIDVRNILRKVLYASNVGIAHLTNQSTRDNITVDEVGIACAVVISIVNRDLYRKLDEKTRAGLRIGESGIQFSEGSKYGYMRRIADRISP